MVYNEFLQQTPATAKADTLIFPLTRGERKGLGRREKRPKKIRRREKGSKKKKQGDGRTSIKREDGECSLKICGMNV